VYIYIYITGTPESNEGSNQIWGSNTPTPRRKTNKMHRFTPLLYTPTPVQQRDANIQKSLYEALENGIFYTNMKFLLNGNDAQLHQDTDHALIRLTNIQLI
jgi:hypothetical protein